jgi:lactoylglutathione lyase
MVERADAGMTLRLELHVSKPERPIDFYTNILGFTLIRAGEDYSELQRDAVTLGIGLAEGLDEENYFSPEIETDKKGLGVEIVFEVNDIRRFYEEVKQTGYPIREDIGYRPHGLTDFRLVDPDGYYLRPTSRERE